MNGILRTLEKDRSGVVYRSLVESLYADTKILAVGVVGTSFAIGVTAAATNSVMLWGLAALYLMIGVVRLVVNHLFHRVEKNENFTDRVAQRWERFFAIGVCAHALSAGFWVFISCYIGDTVAQNGSLAVTFGSLIGVCCRSYPFERLVTWQVLCVFMPMWAGLTYLGGYHSVLGALLALYMISISNIAKTLRKVLLENIFQRRAAEYTAKRFDTALTNIPQGVCMFSAAGRLEVANRHICRTVGKTENELIGSSLTDWLGFFSRHMNLKDQDTNVLVQWANSKTTDDLLHVMEVSEGATNTIKCRAKHIAGGGIIVTIEDITKEVQAAQEIDHMRKHDRLTGLYNRLYFTSQLDSHSFYAGPDAALALLFVNLDRFKLINDAMGHRFGDQLLCEAANRVKMVCSGAGRISRYGGNEFAIALYGADASELSEMMADTLISALEEPFRVDGRVVHLSASVGIARRDSHAITTSQLIDQAGLALDAAKGTKGGEWCVYDEEMGKKAQNQRKLEEDLRLALARDQFEAYFQPLVSVREGRISTCEALIRWQHPVLGSVSPDRFIPIAEQIGEIGKIGAWMLMESCRVCKSWPDNTRVAVNISPIQFGEGNIVETVRNVLLETGLEPWRLELEITESLMLDDMADTIEKLEQFKKMGVSISLDDFGTGYSCLSYMNQLPIDKVKIDRSFVRDLETNSKSLALVKAITGLGHQLGLRVVVEGIEDQKMLTTLLKHADIDELQGYYFSKPRTVEGTARMFLPADIIHQTIRKSLKGTIQQVA